MVTIRTILCPTDFFDCSRYAFRLAGSLARAHGARLVVLHVLQPPDPMVAYGEALKRMQPPAVRDNLLRALRRFRIPTSRVRLEHWLVEGDPADEILRIAREIDCDVIVMGSHSRSSIGRLVMGSVADEVAREATCPVVTVRVPRAHPTPGCTHGIGAVPTAHEQGSSQ
jgi:nucleotide-binding universal stress UspA family protein